MPALFTTSHDEYTNGEIYGSSGPHLQVSSKKSSISLLTRSKSALFNTTPVTPLRRKMSKPLLRNEESYCVLSEQGVEVVAASTTLPEHGDPDVTLASIPSMGRKLKRAASLSTLLKTPSQLASRKTASKLRLFGSTPDTASTAVDTPDAASALDPAHLNYSGPFSDPTVPAVPGPQDQACAKSPHPDSPTLRLSHLATDRNNNTSEERTRTQSVISTSERPQHGTVASRISHLERRASDDSTTSSVAPSGSVLPPIPSSYSTVRSKSGMQTSPKQDAVCTNMVNAGKTPPAKHGWLRKLHFGRHASVKRRDANECLVQDAILDGSLSNESEKHKSRQLSPPPLRADLVPTAFVAPKPDNSFEVIADHLSEAVLHSAISEPSTPLHSLVNKPSTSYFSLHPNASRTSITSYSSPSQLLRVATSAYAGDVHVSVSPFRVTKRMLDPRINDQSARRCVLDGGNDETTPGRSKRPKSEPLPLRDVHNANEDLRNLLDGFEETCIYESRFDTLSIASSHADSPCPPSVVENGIKITSSGVPYDLLDLIDAALSHDAAFIRPLSRASLFEGNVWTAHDSSSFNNIDFAQPSLESHFSEDEDKTLSPVAASSSSDSVRSARSPSRRHRRHFSSATASNRSSLREYLTMERPSVGDRMLEDVDEDVVLAPIASYDLRSSIDSTRSTDTEYQPQRYNRESAVSKLSAVESAASDGVDYFASPTPAFMASAAVIVTRQSMQLPRPSIDSIDSRPSIDSLPPSPTVRKAKTPGLLKALRLQPKQSTSSSISTSLFSAPSSINSSPCPGPPRRKLLMLTSNRTPKPAVMQDIAVQTSVQAATSAGRVRQLKNPWEAKFSLDEGSANLSASSESPRSVRPLPTSLGKFEVPRSRPLSSLSLTGSMVPPDTPPPSSPAASDLSYGDYRSSLDVDQPSKPYGFKQNKHRRQSSQLSKHSVLNEANPEEKTALLTNKSTCSPIVESAGSTMTLEAYGEDVGKSFSPLQLRKKLSRKSMRKVSSKPNMKAVRRPLPTPPVEIEPQVRVIEGDDDYELDEREVRLVHFYREAVAEIASSRARFPDTKAALEALSYDKTWPSPVAGVPSLSSPTHQSAFVNFILDSRDRYRSSFESAASSFSIDDYCSDPVTDYIERGVPDVHAIPELSFSVSRNAKFVISPPSPIPIQSQAMSAHKPKPLLLAQRFSPAGSAQQVSKALPLQAVNPNLQAATAAAGKAQTEQKRKSTKGFVPRVPLGTNLKPLHSDRPNKNEAMAQLGLGRPPLRSAASGSSFAVHRDAASSPTPKAEKKAKTNSSTGLGKAVSSKRYDALNATRRKLEGIRDADDKPFLFDSESGSDDTGVLSARGSLAAFDVNRVSMSRPKPKIAGRRSAIPQPARALRV